MIGSNTSANDLADRVGPAGGGFAITPSDSVDLVQVCRGVYVGTAGDLKVTMPWGGTLTFKNLAAGMIHPIAAKRVFATGTAATDIIGLL